jgi:hypothetical protein
MQMAALKGFGAVTIVLRRFAAAPSPKQAQIVLDSILPLRQISLSADPVLTSWGHRSKPFNFISTVRGFDIVGPALSTVQCRSYRSGHSSAALPSQDFQSSLPAEQTLADQSLAEEDSRPERVLADELAPSLEHPQSIGPESSSRGDMI